jgi:transposase/transposase-like protein
MVKNLKDVMRKFNTEEKCRKFLIEKRWNGKPVCPYCGCDRSYFIDNGKRIKCANNKCYKKYSVTLGTVMEASNIPLTTWLPAMYIIIAHKKGISSVQLAKDLGVTQKTAWFMNHRIREYLKENSPEMLSGTVEIDETYMGKKFRSEYQGLSPKEVDSFQAKPKQKTQGAVIGLIERETNKLIVKSFKHRNAEMVKGMATNHISPEAKIITDEASIYRKVLANYNRETVNHSKGEWVRKGNIHTNNIEAFWSVMKRGVYGIYHQISYKHLQRYCDEFSFRYNTRHQTDGERFLAQFSNLEGKRLSYKQLVHGKENSQKSNPKA